MGLGNAHLVISRELRDFGFWSTLHDLFFRSVKRIVKCEIWKVVFSEIAHPDFTALPEGYEARLLSASAMTRHIGPEADLTEEIVQHAMEKGDECVAIFRGDRLATYAWYSTEPTAIDHELQLRFRNDYVYLYKAFTHPDFRGCRLHAIATTLAMSEYQHRGRRGIVSAISAHNFSSLKAFYRMGFRDLGKVYGIRVAGRHLLYHSKACRDFGFAIGTKQVIQAHRASRFEVA